MLCHKKEETEKRTIFQIQNIQENGEHPSQFHQPVVAAILFT